MDRRPALPSGVIDDPADGALVDCDYLRVTGWALADPFVSRIEVRINGHLAGRARLGLARPDLATRTHIAAASVCGFDFEVDLARWAEPATEALIEATAFTPDGDSFGLKSLSLRTKPQDPTPVTEEPFHSTIVGRYVPDAELSGLRVAIFMQDLLRAGSQLRLLELLGHLVRERALSFTVVSPTDGPMRADLALLGVPVHICGSYSYDSVEGYRQRVDELASWIHNESFNLIWANTLIAFIGLEVAEATGVPSLFVVHESQDLPIFWGPDRLAGGMAGSVYERAKELFSSASKVVLVCEAQRKIFERYETGSDFTVIPNAVDVAVIEELGASVRRQAARGRCGVGPPERLLLCTGIISPRKSQTSLALSFRLLLSDHPATVLAMVGDIGGSYAQGLRSYVDRAGLGANVRILPLVPDISDWYLAADLLVSPSVDEAQPSVVLEAIAYRVPVVSTRVGGVPEVIQDGVTGLLCEPGDIADLARAVDTALRLPEPARQAMIEASAVEVRRSHDAAKTAQQYVEVIRMLAAAPKRDGDAPSTYVPRDMWPRARELVIRNEVEILVKELSAQRDSFHRLGIDMMLGIAVDLAILGVPRAGGVLALGGGMATISSLLSDFGYHVTPLETADLEPLREHLAGSDEAYEVALLLTLEAGGLSHHAPTPSPDEEGPHDVLTELCAHVRRCLYVEVPAEDDRRHRADTIRADLLPYLLLERQLASGLEWVASTVGPDGSPRRLYRVDLR